MPACVVNAAAAWGKDQPPSPGDDGAVVHRRAAKRAAAAHRLIAGHDEEYAAMIGEFVARQVSTWQKIGRQQAH